jgi:hypothetical protein
MVLPAHKMTSVTLRHVHLKLEQETYERARQAAEADRRSLANWLTVLVERALEGGGPQREDHRGPQDAGYTSSNSLPA